MNKKILLAVGIFTAFAFNVNAWEFKPYAGIDMGWSQADIDKLEDRTGYFDLDNDFFVVSINAGAKFNKFFGVETSILSSSNAETEYTFEDVRLSYTSAGIDAVGYVPLYKDKFELFGTAGFAYHYMKMEVERYWGWGWGKRTITKNESQFAPRIGAGFQYNMNSNFSFRALVRHTFIDHKYVDSLTEVITGVRYNF